MSNKYPILNILFPFMLGIYVAIKCKIELQDTLIIVYIALTLLLLFVFLLLNKKFSKQKSVLFSVLVICLFFATGVLKVASFWDYLPVNHFSKMKADHFIVKVLKPPIEKAKSYKTEVEIVQAIDYEGTFLDATGTALVYFQKDSMSAKLRYAQQLIIPTKFNTIAPPANPYQFDYKQFLSYKNIFYQAYFRTQDVAILSQEASGVEVWFFSKIYNLRKFYRDKLIELLPNKNNVAVASALLLGDKQLLHRDLQATYQDTGAMHILAVSGLHVGIISAIIVMLLSVFNGFKHRRIYKGVSAIMLLWIFACLTGLAPSVTRATLMFSIIIIGRFIARPVHIYNSLGVSAFILLMFNPFLLMELGFQLSYLAVLGIVLFHSEIMNFFTPKNKIAKSLWEINVVAISAQALTLPLTIATFHQFPLIFFLSNPIAIYGATLILGIGLLFFMLVSLNTIVPIDILTDWTAYFLNGTLSILNYLLGCIQNIPYGTLKGLFVNSFQYYLLSVILLLFAFHFKNKKLLKAIVPLSLILVLNLLFTTYQQNKETELSIFHLNNKSALSLRQGHESVLFHTVENETEIAYLLGNSLLAQGGKKIVNHNFNDSLKTNSIWKNNTFVHFDKTTVLLIDKSNYYHLQHWQQSVDYLLVRENPFLKIGEIYEQLNPKKIIFDGSNAQKNCAYWLAECEQQNLPCHFTATDGAFSVILNDD